MTTTHPKFIVCKLTIDAIKSTLGFAVLLALADAAQSISAQSLDGKFDVGGRRIRLACQGSGYPTVVIDAGLGTAAVEDAAWQQIASKIAAVTRVCLYDRAGRGGSDPNPKQVVTNLDSATDMARALDVAGFQGPFLVVGHSVGGLQKQFLQLSTNWKQHIAATAGHHLPNEAPDFVIDGILEGVHDVRQLSRSLVLVIENTSAKS